MDTQFTFFYGHKWSEFLAQLQLLSREILQHEAKVDFRRNRLHHKGISYPLLFTLFEHPTRLGYFNANFMELGIHRLFIYTTTQELKNLLRHELGHYLCYIFYGDRELGHGKLYRQLCQKYGWGPEVYLSKQQIDLNHYRQLGQQENKTLNKIKKLLTLSTSSNRYEAELAAAKANELLIKHSIDQSLLNQTPQISLSDTIVKRLYNGKKATAKYRALANILHDFYVAPIFNHGQGEFYLEIVGSYSKVEIASYVFTFLEHKFEQLWQEDRKQFHLKGMRAKNSYFLGLAEGITKKNRQQRASQFQKQDLIPLEKEVTHHKQIAYSRLRNASSGGQEDPLAKYVGKAQGSQLAINPALTKNSPLKKLLLGFKK